MDLKEAHPLLQKLVAEVKKKYPKLKFQVLEARRGRVAQETAYAKGNSKAHFGQSPHNYTPAIALDIVPIPLNWKDINAFKALAPYFLNVAKELNIPISWGGNWKSFKDYPHYELTPWSTYAKKASLYKGK